MRARFLEQLKRVEKSPQTVLDLTKQFLTKMTAHLAKKMQVAESPTQVSYIRAGVEEASYLPIERMAVRLVPNPNPNSNGYVWSTSHHPPRGAHSPAVVTFRANPSHNLTRSFPYHLSASTPPLPAQERAVKALLPLVSPQRAAKLKRAVHAMRELDQARFDISERVRDRPHGGGAGAGASARLGAWGRAIVEMRGMDSERLPTRKLERLLAAVAAVCEIAHAQAHAQAHQRSCAEGSSAVPSATSSLGADDLLPVLAYLVVKSNLACAALTSLTIYSVCDLKGEAAYYHTLFDSAITVVAEQLFDAPPAVPQL